MATITFTLPDDLASWIDEQVQKGEFETASSYIQEVLLQDYAFRDVDPLTLDELRAMIAEARTGGVTDASVDDAFDAAMQIVAERRGRVA